MTSEPGPITRATIAAGLIPDKTITSADFTGGQDKTPRHPTRVTADRIAEHLEKYADQLTPREVVACSQAVQAFADIADGRRA